MPTGSILPLNVAVNVTSSLESVAYATAQLPYNITVAVTTSSLVTVPVVIVGVTSSLGTHTVVSAVQPYLIAVGTTQSVTQVVPSNVLPYTVAVNVTSSFNTAVVVAQTTPNFTVSTNATLNAVSASLAALATNAILALQAVTASYALSAGSVAGLFQSASFAITSSYATSASYAPNGYIPPVGLISSSVQINTGSFSGSITTASYATTASFAVSASHAVTSDSNKDIQLTICSNQPANTVIQGFSSQLNEPDASDRMGFDFSTYSQYRVQASMIRAGPSGSKLGIQYSTDQTNWKYLDVTSGSVIPANTIGLQSTQWINLNVTAQSDVFIRWIAVGGDDLTNATFRYISLGVR